MPKHLYVLKLRWERWLGWHWILTDVAFGFLGGWLVSLFGLAVCAAVALLGQTLYGAEGSLGTGALIVALLSAPFLVWNTVIRHRALQFQKEGHLTDRLAKAVEQLGAERVVKRIVLDENGESSVQENSEPNLEVRIGGLLLLERIAQDSTAYDMGRDHVRVMEIICAYIRNNAPAKDAPQYQSPNISEPVRGASQQEISEYRCTWDTHFGPNGQYEKWLEAQPRPREDVQIALKILDRRSSMQRRVEAAFGQEDDVWEANWPFEPTILDRSLLEENILSNGDIFSYARLRSYDGATSQAMESYQGYRLDLRRTCLRNASFQNYRLGGARLTHALLEGTDFSNARLEGVLWKNSIFEKTNFTDSYIENGVKIGMRLGPVDE